MSSISLPTWCGERGSVDEETYLALWRWRSAERAVALPRCSQGFVLGGRSSVTVHNVVEFCREISTSDDRDKSIGCRVRWRFSRLPTHLSCAILTTRACRERRSSMHIMSHASMLDSWISEIRVQGLMALIAEKASIGKGRMSKGTAALQRGSSH